MRILLLVLSFPLTIVSGLFAWLAADFVVNPTSHLYAVVALIYSILFGVYSLFNSILAQPNWTQATGLVGMIVADTLMFMY
jgi:hypothetical protein